MRTKVKGNLLLNADIITPEKPYAVFDDSLTKQAKKELSLAINYGCEMLKNYKSFRDNLHIVSVVDMLKNMEEVFQKFDHERFEALRLVWEAKKENGKWAMSLCNPRH